MLVKYAERYIPLFYVHVHIVRVQYGATIDKNSIP